MNFQKNALLKLRPTSLLNIRLSKNKKEQIVSAYFIHWDGQSKKRCYITEEVKVSIERNSLETIENQKLRKKNSFNKN